MAPRLAPFALIPLLAACPSPPGEGEGEPALDVQVSAPTSPPADPADAPPLDGTLPEGVPGDVRVFDLGLLGVSGGLSGEIVVEVQAGLAALQVLVWGQPDAHVILWRAEAPDGRVVVDDTAPSGLSDSHRSFARGFPGQVFSVNRVFGAPWSGAFLVPNTPAVAPSEGTWRLVVGHFQVGADADPALTPVDRPVRVVVLATPRRSAGALPLNVHLTGARGLTTASATSDSFLQDALAVVRETYAQADIEVTPVRYLDASADFQVVDLVDDECAGGDMVELLRGAAPPERGLDLFVVEAFTCRLGPSEVGASIGGLSAGLPGPAWVSGSSHAGVVVATGFAAGDGARLGLVAAHEMGHYLGLFHTRESSLFGNDPIYDTLEDTFEDADSVRDNLMFFAPDGSTELTQDQGAVLRSFPLVH